MRVGDCSMFEVGVKFFMVNQGSKDVGFICYYFWYVDYVFIF